MRRFFAVFISVLLLSSVLLLPGCSTTGVKSAYKSPYQQLEKPAVGDEIAVLHTDMGDITVRFFPEAAPKTVENFKGLAKKGAFNNQPFYRVINDFMIQGGNQKDTNSLWGGSFEDEFDPNLMNIRGALSMANSGSDTNGSQFFIVQANASAFNGWDYYKQMQETFAKQGTAEYDYNSWTEEQKKIYEENGGTPWLDGGHRTDDKGHAVFGQVISGMDVVDKIATAPGSSSGSPEQMVIIRSVELMPYQG